MQTPAEKKLIELLQQTVKQERNLKFINLGAGKSTVIEKRLFNEAGGDFVVDRIDIEDCTAQLPGVGECYLGSIEKMPQVSTGVYHAAFANYVLEHVADLNSASREIYRILKTGGFFATTTSNPRAPEFILSKFTPLWLHQKIRGADHPAFETEYAAKSVPELVRQFEQNGFTLQKINYFSFTQGYLYRFPVLNQLAWVYDKIVNFFKIRFLSGNVFLVLVKK